MSQGDHACKQYFALKSQNVIENVSIYVRKYFEGFLRD